jgi:hypothetical protein
MCNRVILLYICSILLHDKLTINVSIGCTQGVQALGLQGTVWDTRNRGTQPASLVHDSPHRRCLPGESHAVHHLVEPATKVLVKDKNIVQHCKSRRLLKHSEAALAASQKNYEDIWETRGY